MVPIHVALASNLEELPALELCRVADAIEQQIMRDFGPIWKVDARVRPFTRLEDIPKTHWPVIIRDDISAFAPAGYHGHSGGRPRAVVQYADRWSLTASHEILEMLANPFCRRFVPGRSVKPGQGRVNYLVEVCDPCADPRFSYGIDETIVSDFVTPDYFGLEETTTPGYSLCGNVMERFDVLTNGRLTWRDPSSDHWWQLRRFDGTTDILDCGVRKDPGIWMQWQEERM